MKNLFDEKEFDRLFKDWERNVHISQANLKYFINQSIREGQKAAVREFINQKQLHHDTYNGGYHQGRENEIFHHGMETVFNSLADYLAEMEKS